MQFSSRTERPAILSAGNKRCKSPVQRQAYRNANVSPSHCVPVSYGDRSVIAKCVESQSDVRDIGDPEGLQIVPHDGKLGSGVQHCQSDQEGQEIAVSELLGDEQVAGRRRAVVPCLIDLLRDEPLWGEDRSQRSGNAMQGVSRRNL
jgi:hypothetical protein